MRFGAKTRLSVLSVAAMLAVGTAVAVGSIPAAAATACRTTASGTGWSIEVCLTVTAEGVVSGDVPVSATATTSGTGAPRVAKLEFDLRGDYLLTDYEAPYAFTLRTSDFVDGAATLAVSAVLRDGSVSDQASLTTTLSNGVTVQPGPTGSYTPPGAPPSTQTAPLVVAAVGDGAGGETAATSVTDMIAGWSPQLLTYLGDVYEDGTITEFRNWYGDASTWYGRFRGITAPVVGNHEYNRNAAGDYEADGYFRYWNAVPHYYSYDAGGWHFIALDSTTQFDQTAPGTPQYEWLANDLESRSNPCTVVTYHHPLNTVGSESPSQRMADIWALLRQHKVTLVLNGHDHQYQHWTALGADQLPDPAGVTQIIAGAGGHSSQAITVPDEPRVVAAVQGYGALRLEVRPDRVDYSYRMPDGGPGKVVDAGFVGCKALTADTQPPGAPPAVTATVNPTTTSVQSVTVTWQPASDNRGVAQYKVLRDGVVVGTVSGSTTSFVNSGLSAASTYSFTVRALDAAGNQSPPSAAATVTTPPPTPSTVTATSSADAYVSSSAPGTNYGLATSLRLDASPVQHAYVRFAVVGAYPAVTAASLKIWANNRSTTGLVVKKVADTSWSEANPNGVTYSSAPAVGAQVGPVTPTTAGGWATVDVTPAIVGDGLYSFDLSTTSSTAFTLASKEAGAATTPTLVVQSIPPPDTTAPSAPSGLTATATGQNEVDLAWNSSTDNAGGTGLGGYTVYRDDVALDTVPANVRTYVDTTVGAGSTYRYVVDAVDVAGNRSAQSAPASATPPDETPPELPDPFTAVPTSTSSVRLAWGASTDNVGVTGYRIRRGNGVIANLAPTAGSYTDPGRSPGATYTYSLAARDAVGNWSAPVVAHVTMPTGQGGQPPTAPTTVTATALGETDVQVEWSGATDDTGITAYEIWRNGAPFTLVPVSVESWTNTGLTPGTTYTYSVRAIDTDAQYSPQSPTASATTWPTDTQAPSAPTGLVGAGASTTSVSLSWNASTDDRGVASYRVYRDGTAVADVAAPTTTWTDVSLAVGETRQYAVDAVDGAGNRSAATAPVSVRTQVPPPVTQTFPVTEDTYANSASPTATSQGVATTWRMDGDPVVRAYLKFAPSGLQPVVTSVRLCSTSNAKSSVFAVKATSTAWTEGTLSWNTAPAAGGTVGTSTATSAAGLVCVPVAAGTVTGAGPVAFQLSQTGTTAVAYQAKEAGPGAAFLEVTSSY
ncbi:MAG: fibronectin type III domain-containing protein [Kineosporiaceae bacterium]